MIGGESFNGTGENSRETNQKRGEKVLDAHEASVLNRINELEAEKQQLLAEIAKLKQGEFAQSEQAQGAPEAAPENNQAQGAPENAGAAVVTKIEKSIDGGAAESALADSAAGQNAEAVAAENNVGTGENAETEHQAKVEQAKNAAKKNKTFKQKLVPVVTAALLLLTTLTAGVSMWQSAHMAQVPDNAPAVESVYDYEDEERIGIYDGYGEKGMWLSENKGGYYRFACAKEVLEETDGDVKEAVKYAAKNQSESFADYLAALPEEMQPEGFKGLSILEAESKLESMSDEEYETVKNNFNFIMDNASHREVTLNGRYDNAYMRLGDTGGAVDHQNMKLVHCVTNEKGTKATEFYWVDKDGNEIGSMTIKVAMNEDGGNGCIQAVEKEGSSDVYQGMEDVEDEGGESVVPGSEETPEDEPGTPGDEPETPDDPEPEPESEPEPEPTPKAPKDAENLTRIDEQIEEDIEEDIHTEDLNITPTAEVSQEDVTEKPGPEVYDGTEATFVQNETSKSAEQIQETINPVNDYSQDEAPANYTPEELPVQPNEAAQEQADQEQADQTPATLDEAVNNFGFN